MLEIYKDFYLEAAHYLPRVDITHKCRKVHGHSYMIRVYIKGQTDTTKGWVQDYGDISSIFKEYIWQILDHQCLNDIQGLENPTAENMALWIWERLNSVLPMMSAIEIKESKDSGCIYRP